MKLFVDDERKTPDDSWLLVKSSEEALRVIKYLRNNDLEFNCLSLDHDLSTVMDYDDDSRCIMMYMCQHDYWPTNLWIHTANPCGEEWLVGMAQRYGPPGVLVGYGPDYWNPEFGGLTN